LTYATTALLSGDSVIIDRCNFDPKQRQHWTKLADEIQFEQENMPILKDKFINDSQNPIESRIKKIFKLCLVLPNSNDVRFCSDRAFGRGDDGVHEPGD
jgi:hypothetical protein